MDRWARFIRWDRAGAVVTARFDYVANPQQLADFFWCFAHMDDVQRGLDPTVCPATKKEATRFRDAAQKFVRDMNMPKDPRIPSRGRKLPHAELTLDQASGYPVWKVNVNNNVTGKSASLAVGRPFAGHSDVLGRGTRGYIAYDLSADRLLFLKDTWRHDNLDIEPEFETFQQLHEHHVPHIPAVYYGGDVINEDGSVQETDTHVHSVVEEEWLVTDDVFGKLIHHRLVQDIAYPIESAHNDREFIQAFHDVLVGEHHIYAIDRMCHTHRDHSH